MENSFFPVFTTPTIIETSETTFHKFDEVISINVPSNLVKKLINLCDGTKTINEVSEQLENQWDKNYVLAFFAELKDNNLIVNKLEMAESAWQSVENPSPFSSSITDEEVSALVEQARKNQQYGFPEKTYNAETTYLVDLLNQRESTRSFSGDPIPTQSLINMLWAAYGTISTENHYGKTTPSAGALYPSLVRLVLFQDVGEIATGIYELHLGSTMQVGFNLISRDTAGIVRSFVDPLTPENACGMIAVCGSCEQSRQKYGNRSLLYTVLEAGHIAQNFHMAAYESQVATVEIGGFYEQLLSEQLVLPEDYRPLTSVVFGSESKDDTGDEAESRIETIWRTPFVDQYRPEFSIMLAKMTDRDDRSWSSGKDASPRLAKTKALAEAREWASYDKAPEKLPVARLSELDNAVHPDEIFKLHQSQYEINGFPLQPFNEAKAYAWVKAVDILRESEVQILADHVYADHPSSDKRCAGISSSGVAAHPKRMQAIKNGTLELVERDAFMNAYLGRLTHPTILHKSLPEKIRQRINHLADNGFQVWVKDISLDLAPVVFILAQNNDLTFTTCASCSHFDKQEAVNHALMEVEQSVLSGLTYRNTDIIKPTEVNSVHDHGTLYSQAKHFQKADFLVRGGGEILLENVGARAAYSWEKLLSRFLKENRKLLTVPLYLDEKLGGNQGLHIIRSIVPGLVPIGFGHMQEPRGMERIIKMAKKFGDKSITYRDMPKFPHPFI